MSLRILAYNDTETAHDDPNRIAQLAGLLQTHRDLDTLVIGGGDDVAVGGTALLTDAGITAARPFFEAVTPDVTALGNHELDDGIATAANWIKQAPTQYLSANLHAPDTPLGEAVEDTSICTIDNRRVGIVGITHPEAASFAGVADQIAFTDPIKATEQACDQLCDHGIDYLVIASHCGTHDPAVARTVGERIAIRTDSDDVTPAIVVGGHHTSRRSTSVNGTLLIRTAGGGQTIGEIVLPGSSPANAGPTTRFHRVSDASPDSTVSRAMRNQLAEAGIARTVAVVDEPVTRTRTDRIGESRIGNWLADAVRAATDASLGLMPAGLPRVGPPLAGPVTAASIAGLAPYPDDVAEFELDGAAIQETIKTRAAPADEAVIGCHLSGTRVQLTADGGIESIQVNGKRLDLDRSYRVGTTAFLAETDAFARFDSGDIVARYEQLPETLIRYAERAGFAGIAQSRVSWIH